MDIENKVKKIVKEQLFLSNVELKDKIVEDLGADSLDAVELLMWFEEEFDIEIMDEEAEKISTVDDIVKFIEGKAK